MKKSIAQLKRDSKMLDQVLAVIADMMYKSSRPMFKAVLDYWREGWKAQTIIECAALDSYRQECREGANPNNLNSRREIVSRVVLLMLEDVYPEIKEEGGNQ